MNSLIASILVHWILYQVLYWDIKNHNYVSRIIASIQAVVTSSWSVLLICGLIEPQKFLDYQPYVIGYLLFDLIYISTNYQLRKSVSKAMYIHHLLFLYFATLEIENIPYDIARAYLAEISNPLLHYCYYLHQTGQKIKWAGVATLVVYLVARIINFTELLYQATFAGRTETNRFIQLCIISLTLMNYYWFWLLIKIFLKNIGKKAN